MAKKKVKRARKTGSIPEPLSIAGIVKGEKKRSMKTNVEAFKKYFK